MEQADRRAGGAREHPGVAGPQSVDSEAVLGPERLRTARTLDQLRADAFVSIFESLDHDHTVPSGGSAGRDDAAPSEAPAARPGGPVRRRAHRSTINVTISATTLAGLDEKPAELAGYGPIPAPLAREIIGETQASSTKGRSKGEREAKGETVSGAKRGAKLRYLALDDNGQPAVASTTAYRPGHDLSAAVTAREQYCTFPGCRIPACYTDLDHIEPYQSRRAGSGEPQTRLANLQPLCRSHHNLKTAGLWTTRREPDGTLVWTSARTGHAYQQTPEPLPGVHADHPPPPQQSSSARASAHPPMLRCVPGLEPTGVTTPHERALLGEPRADPSASRNINNQNT